MLKKIRELANIKQEIDSLARSMELNRKSLDAFESSFKAFEGQLKGMHKSHDHMLDKFKEEIDSIDELKQRMHEELYDLKLIKSQVKNRIIEKFEQELSQELKISLEMLKQQMGSYSQVREDISNLSAKAVKASEGVDKLIEISSSIRKEDFELKKCADELRKNDKEKLELMKRIDGLERLISKMRRRR